jgi:4-amino-4-deoxy-L-arabinose transferase-like glycosyltransferase
MSAGHLRNAQFAAAVIATFALFLLFVGKPIPIIIWDEGRIIISAMEMRHSGMGLVATYDFHQDLWNTKPPLLIWLMTGSMAWLGPTEFALRLPSLISSLCTILLVMLFLRRITSSVPIAAFGGIALAVSVGFFGEHGARTADYDALLCFFTTSYLMLLFFALHRSPPPRRWLLLAGLMGAGALLTKGVAGGVPGTGLLLYLLLTHRWHRLFETPLYLAASLLAVAPVGLFLVLREATVPGYLHAMIYNDVTGRFSEALDNHSGPPWYYLDATFIKGLFSLGTAALFSPLALPLARGRVRLAMIFALCIALGQLVSVTTSGTKLTHYYLSAYPFVAIAAALAVHTLLIRSRAQTTVGNLPPRTSWIARLVPAALLALGVVQAANARQTVLAPREHYPRARYGALLDALSGEHRPVLVIERGSKIPDDPHYAPELRFYVMVAHEKGRLVEQTGEISRMGSAAPGVIVASCDPSVTPLLQSRGAEIVVEREGCFARRQGSIVPRVKFFVPMVTATGAGAAIKGL